MRNDRLLSSDSIATVSEVPSATSGQSAIRATKIPPHHTIEANVATNNSTWSQTRSPSGVGGS